MQLACIVVTYNPAPERFANVVNAVLDSPADLIIFIDNGSERNTLDTLEHLTTADPRIRVHCNNSNLGIAAAQNIGIANALATGCQYALLLDHDSIPCPGLIANLLSCARDRVAAGDRLAAVGARTIDPRNNQEHGFAVLQRGIWRRVRCPANCTGIVDCEFLNASGSLLYLPAWQKIGPFDESFFIDHVETDWYMRARHGRYRVYGLCTGYLDHTMGDDISRYWWLHWRSMPRRSPERHYTIVRNSLWLYRKPYTPASWIINNLAKLVFTLVYFSLADRDRKSQFRNILYGIWHGLLKSPELFQQTPHCRKPSGPP